MGAGCAGTAPPSLGVSAPGRDHHRNHIKPCFTENISFPWSVLAGCYNARTDPDGSGCYNARTDPDGSANDPAVKIFYNTVAGEKEAYPFVLIDYYNVFCVDFTYVEQNLTPGSQILVNKFYNLADETVYAKHDYI